MRNHADEGLRVPDEFHDSHDSDSGRTTPRKRASERESAPDRDLAQFNLLADPTTISGETSTERHDDRDDEAEQLRSALYGRAGEETARNQEPPSTAAEDPRARGPLLNSAEARRLADDARTRQQASRAALASAQDALRGATPASQALTREAPNAWQQRSLVRPSPSTRTGDSQTSAFETKATDPSVEDDENERLLALQLAARAEIRELRATLAVARHTTSGQKSEITQLRGQLALQNEFLEPSQERTRATELDNSDLQRVLDEAISEQARLCDRLRLNERETDTRDAERVLLRQTLVERESEIAARRVQLDELRERFDVQDQALENARLQFERERRRNTATQELLARLRQTLSTDLSSEFSSQQTPDAPPDDPAEIALSRDDSDFAVYEETAEPTPRE